MQERALRATSFREKQQGLWLTASKDVARRARSYRTAGDQAERRSTISFLISAIALAGFRPFGQVRAQFMIVWQR